MFKEKLSVYNRPCQLLADYSDLMKVLEAASRHRIAVLQINWNTLSIEIVFL